MDQQPFSIGTMFASPDQRRLPFERTTDNAAPNRSSAAFALYIVWGIALSFSE